MRYRNLTLLAGGVLAALSCTDGSPVGLTAATPARTSVVSVPAFGPWAKIVQGETGPGSLYALYIPQNWNRQAVYFAHGIRLPVPHEPISLDNNQNDFFAVRDALGAKGYAFAYSSYSENGLAVKDGAQRTHQLRGLLASELQDQPERNYLVGYSLGALVALELGERFPTHYDGVLAMCGMVGGTPLEVTYVGDVRALFDHYYPGVLPGTVTSVPSTPLTPAEIRARVSAALSASPTAAFGMFAIASTAQTPLAYVPNWAPTTGGIESSLAFQTMAQSLITALFYQNIGIGDIVARTHGHSPYDNRNTVYTLGAIAAPPAPGLSGLIASMVTAAQNPPAGQPGIDRYDITPDALNYLEQYYVPTGNLQIPVVSVHNVSDPLVPFFHEPAFAQRAAGSGMLLQRSVDNYGHCSFNRSQTVSNALVVDSFQTLVDWVTTGDKPTS
ncbi:MAG: hypothetical protein ACJ78G_03900 [Gemmatimonadaceae bacterium]